MPRRSSSVWTPPVAQRLAEKKSSLHSWALLTFLSVNAAYYEDITRDNLQLIKELREENALSAANNRSLRKEIEALTATNRKLALPLRQQEALR